MKTALLVVAAAALFAAGAANAQSGADVVKAKGCMNCHDIEKKKIASSFKDIAARQKDVGAAEAALVGKLKDGKGHVKAAASEAEIKAAVQYVLAQK